MLIDQIKEEQKLLEEDSANEEKGFLKAASAFKQKALPVPELKQQSIDDIKKAAQKLANANPSPIVETTEKLETKSILKKDKKSKKD